MARKVFIISHNLTETANKLQIVLQTQYTWHKIFDTTWLIATNETPNQIYDKLQPFLDQNKDRLFIGEITKSEYAGWLSRTIWEWIKINQNSTTT